MIEFILKKKYLDEDYQKSKNKISNKKKNKYFNITVSIFFGISFMFAITNDYGLWSYIFLISIILNLLIPFRVKEKRFYKMILILINILGVIVINNLKMKNWDMIYYFILLYIFNLIIYIISTIYIELYNYNKFKRNLESKYKEKSYKNKSSYTHIIILFVVLITNLQNQLISNTIFTIIIPPSITFIETVLIKNKKTLL